MTRDNEQVSFHCLAVARAGYRGICRYSLFDLMAILSVENLITPDVEEALMWTHHERQLLSGTRIETIDNDPRLFAEVPHFLAGIPWVRVSPHVPRDYEIVAGVRVAGPLTDAQALAMTHRALTGNHALGQRSLAFCGLDIVEWPSNWSVLANAQVWTGAALPINEGQLCPDWAAADAVWRAYLAADDPDRGPLEAYRTLGVVTWLDILEVVTQP